MMKRLTKSIVATVVAASALALLASPALGAPLFGFNNTFVTPSAERDDRLNELEVGLGAEIDRIVINWADVDRDRTQQNWEIYDRRIQAIFDAGMDPIIAIQGSPAWAHPGLYCFSSLIFCPPDYDHLDEWANFAYQVTMRYPEAVAIEVWNEPSWHGAWATQEGPNPERYANIFQAAAGAIHFADPAMPVLLGSLTYSQQDRPNGNMSIPTFMRGFAQAGGFGSMRPIDGIGIHVYPWIDEMETLDTQFAAIMRQIRAARDQYAPGMDIWVTETGATTSGPHPVSERQQARTILLILAQLLDDQDLAAVLIHTTVEPPENPRHPAETGSGVLKWEDLRAKLAYCALLARAGGNPATYLGCPDDIEETLGVDIPGGGDPGGGDCDQVKVNRLLAKVNALKAKRAHHRALAAQGNAKSRRALRKIRPRLRATVVKLHVEQLKCQASPARGS